MRDYLILLKPRVIWLLILASVAGYVYASGRSPDPAVLAALILVGILSTGGAAAFNHYWERDIDALMSRTAKRPLPAGRIAPRNALAFSLVLSALGVVLAWLLLGPWPTAMVILGWVFYAVVYTILLKRRTWLNVLFGGVAGNAAFLTGYVSARPLDVVGVLLSLVVYLWIPAHIWSLAYARREDYLRAGVPMLSVIAEKDKAVVLIALMNILASAYMGLLAVLLGGMYLATVVAPLVAAGVYTSIKALRARDERSFWVMFKASNPILAVFLILLMAVSW
jgi:protoheme IX farnesyltransferase